MSHGLFNGDQGMKISLVDTEQDVVRFISAKRIERTRAAGGKNTPYGQDQAKIDLDALGAEVAFCKLFNLFPDLTTNPRLKGSDCNWGRATIDVKQTRHPEGRLIAKNTKDVDDVDIYVLLRGSFPDYELIGWCYSEELINDDNLQPLGDYGNEAYVLPDGKLHAIRSSYGEWMKRFYGEMKIQLRNKDHA